MTSHRQKDSIPIRGITARSANLAQDDPERQVSTLRKICLSLCGWIDVQKIVRTSAKRLHVAESVSLGEKRFVAVVQVDGLQFLIGGSSTNMTLLAQLNSSPDFNSSLEREMSSAEPFGKRRVTKVSKRAIEQLGTEA